ncbi:PD-(D/E)XK nuclease family protein [Simiduia sp. 21SJ11W-1]|uniref:PD-(D/E)XK nuclease family protein n=1 Tax=Simiduia sp. 21SJ11W-1 TaxID=2909669 RepID=UPI00209D367B|nr:PD-(D/E)XK nuclease family protein [Simiduia sp. 21SJ11W-1]UTA46361.1 PD-(D/E)XK nuclease family protein [Simiduia sp. 21SJ11W-1]
MINLQPLAEPLAQGALILTPNNRLKNKVLLAWASQQTGVVSAPRIQSLSGWINERWIRLQRSGEPAALCTLAGPQIRRQLWAKAIQSTPDAAPLIHPRLLIDQLDQAYSYLKLWQVSKAQWAGFGQTAEQARLSHWISHAETEAARLNLCFEEQQLGLLLANLTKNSSEQAPGEAVYLLNFDTITPLHQALLDCAFGEHHGLESNQTQAAQSLRTVCKDPKQELQACALWAKAQLTAKPDQRIAIIDPNLGKNRARLERALARVFEPHHHRPGTQRYTMPFNFSAGTPLAQCPLVHQLLACLRWPKTPAQASSWLNSPFIGFDGDTGLRHWLTSYLLETATPEITLQLLARGLERFAAGRPDNSQTPIRPWAGLLQSLQDLPIKATGSQWANHFTSLIHSLNWPGPRVLDSEEHQQANQLLDCLLQLREADLLESPLTSSEAAHWLSEVASRQPFQPQTPESPLQILGTLESAGLSFDQIWVIGMDDTQWPPPAAPNPLLPAALQRELAMPHASAERELAFCQSLTRNFLCAAHTVIFSHPARDGDRELHTSPLIAHLEPMPAPAIAEPEQPQGPLEWISTAQAPAVSAAELPRLRGGSGMLSRQARCPLAAFFALRLGARRKEPATPGLNALERGQLLHQTLFYFWRAGPDLTTQSPEARAQALQAALDAAFAELPEYLGKRFIALERERLEYLLAPWFEYERLRPAFSIAGLEQALEFSIGGLPLKLQLDRLDQIGDQQLLIDYKSGVTHINKWLGPRPEEPQLPLYAVALTQAGENVQGIAFAELRQARQLLQGIGNPALAPGLKAPNDKTIGLESWQALLAHWQQALEGLAQELLNGHTELQFSSLQSRQYLAEFATLLRTDEQQQISLMEQAQ